MALEFGLLMTLIGVISVFSSLAVVAFTCVVLKKFSREEVKEKAGVIEEIVPIEEGKVEAVKAEAGTFKIKLDGEEHEVNVEDLEVVGEDFGEITVPPEIGEEIKVVVGESEYKVKIEGVRAKPLPIVKKPVKIGREVIKEAKNVIKAPMPGTVVKMPVKVGDKVEKGTVILVLETMKMENTVKSPVSGVIKAKRVSEGDSVKTGDILIVID
jgi:biotin carboxyl carrier protein